MSIADDLAAETAPKPRTCKVCRILAAMPDADREAIEAALADRVPLNTIVRVMNANGLGISHSTMTKHAALCL